MLLVLRYLNPDTKHVNKFKNICKAIYQILKIILLHLSHKIDHYTLNSIVEDIFSENINNPPKNKKRKSYI